MNSFMNGKGYTNLDEPINSIAQHRRSSYIKVPISTGYVNLETNKPMNKPMKLKLSFFNKKNKNEHKKIHIIDGEQEESLIIWFSQNLKPYDLKKININKKSKRKMSFLKYFF